MCRSASVIATVVEFFYSLTSESVISIVCLHMDASKLDVYINLITYGEVGFAPETELQTLIRQLDKEILFFNNLEDSSIYKSQELSKLRSYVNAHDLADFVDGGVFDDAESGGIHTHQGI